MRNRRDLIWSVATSTVTNGISRKVKSRRKPGEKSDEAILLMTIETTELDEREGPLLQPS